MGQYDDTIRAELQYKRNQPFVDPSVVPGDYSTRLSADDEQQFRDWVKKNRVPYQMSSDAPQDYDMRGFWQGMVSGDPHATTGVDPHDKQLHFTDYWKTPYHQTFSRESKFAAPNAPTWTEDGKLVGEDGTVYFDPERDVEP